MAFSDSYVVFTNHILRNKTNNLAYIFGWKYNGDFRIGIRMYSKQ